MMEFLEMILVEVIEEAARSHRMPRDVQIVNVPVPVRAHVIDGGHGRNYTIVDFLRLLGHGATTQATMDTKVKLLSETKAASGSCLRVLGVLCGESAIELREWNK